jgi:hypothetical protein
MSAPVFRLKGAGWYETDFKGDQDHKKNLADRPEADSPKEEKAPEVKAADNAAKDAPKDAEKPAAKDAEKPAEKAAAPAESPKKAAGGGMSKRGTAAKPGPKKPLKPLKPLKKKRAAASKRRA